MKGEMDEIMDFKKQLDELDKKTRNPFSNIYRRWKKKRLINGVGFEYCKEFLKGMDYYTARNVCRMYNNLCDNTYPFKDTFYDNNYDRDLRMTNLRVIMGDYYIELQMDIKVEKIPAIKYTDDSISHIFYDIIFHRDGYIDISRKVSINHKNGHKEEVDTRGGVYTKVVGEGLYENFIIRNTFYKALTYYIFKLLNN